ncbi:unnamed protein product [Arctogadus glacialis]
MGWVAEVVEVVGVGVVVRQWLCERRHAAPLPPSTTQAGTKVPVIAQQKKALKSSISKTVLFWSEHKTPETEVFRLVRWMV